MKIGSIEMPVMESGDNEDCKLKGKHVFANVVVPAKWPQFLQKMREAADDPEGAGMTLEVEPGVNAGMMTAVVFYPDLSSRRCRPAEILAKGEGFGFFATPDMLKQMRDMLDIALNQVHK